MKALIDPSTNNIQYISAWQPNINPVLPQYGKNRPIYSVLPNSERVCQTEPDADIFAVAEPLFWTACPNDCVADLWYYDTSDNICKIIPNALPPTTE
jgi:hypothetical protein